MISFNNQTIPLCEFNPLLFTYYPCTNPPFILAITLLNLFKGILTIHSNSKKGGQMFLINIKLRWERNSSFFKAHKVEFNKEYFLIPLRLPPQTTYPKLWLKSKVVFGNEIVLNAQSHFLGYSTRQGLRIIILRLQTP